MGLQALLGFADLLRSLGMSDDHIRIATILVVGRMLSPGSELHTYDWMLDASAILELLDLEPPSESTLYRTGDRLYALREEIMDGLFGNAQALLGFRETIIFYDLTNVYYHGRKKGALLRYGRSKHLDCVLVTLALTLDATGFARRAEVLPGNASEPKTLASAIDKLNGARPTVIMDAGIATEANLAYLKVKAPDEIMETNSGVKVKTWLLLESSGDQRAKFEAALEALHAGLAKPGYVKDYEKVLVKVERLLERHSRVSYQYKVRVRRMKGTSHAEAVTCRHERARASGEYVLRTSHVDWPPERIGRTYWQLNQWHRIKTVLPENKDNCILLKKDTELTPFRRQIARIMGLKPDNHTYKTRTKRPTRV